MNHNPMNRYRRAERVRDAYSEILQTRVFVILPESRHKAVIDFTAHPIRYNFLESSWNNPVFKMPEQDARKRVEWLAIHKIQADWEYCL